MQEISKFFYLPRHKTNRRRVNGRSAIVTASMNALQRAKAANEARARVSKAYMQMDEIDRNADLSPEGKYRQRSKIAAQRVADFEASKTLARAREAVELAVAKHNFEEDVPPEIAQDSEAMLKARKEVERGWQRAMDKIAERASLTKAPNTRW